MSKINLEPEQHLVQKATRCMLCKCSLPQLPRPIFRFRSSAPINLISQAPGQLAHDSGIPWNDASGKRLRDWLGLTEQEFYAQGLVNVLPMGFCFPGYKNGADAPPIKICAPTWHPQFLAHSQASLTIYIGRYAQQFYLPEYSTLTAAIEDWRALAQQSKFVLPHPSGRNNRWFVKHPWFQSSTLPHLRELINRVRLR